MSQPNVVINLHEHGFRRAFKILQGLGAVSTTDFFNVLLVEVTNIPRFLETLKTWVLEDPSLLKILARVVPVTSTFIFQSPAEFETKAKEVILQWVPELAGKSFHVRMYRRGFKKRISSPEEERFLDRVILEATEQAGNPARITFDNPDAIVVVETVGQWAGLSCWSSLDRQRYPFLRID